MDGAEHAAEGPIPTNDTDVKPQDLGFQDQHNSYSYQRFWRVPVLSSKKEKKLPESINLIELKAT